MAALLVAAASLASSGKERDFGTAFFGVTKAVASLISLPASGFSALRESVASSSFADIGGVQTSLSFRLAKVKSSY